MLPEWFCYLLALWLGQWLSCSFPHVSIWKVGIKIVPTSRRCESYTRLHHPDHIYFTASVFTESQDTNGTWNTSAGGHGRHWSQPGRWPGLESRLLKWSSLESSVYPLTSQRIGFLIYKTIWFNMFLVELPQFDYCNKQELNVNLNLNLWEPASGKLLIWHLVALVGDTCCMMTTNMPSAASVDLDIYLHLLSVIPSSSICWGHCC